MQTELDFSSENFPKENHPGFNGFTFEYSSRMKQSWNVKKRGDNYTLRIPKVLENASIEVTLLICDWARLSFARKTVKNKIHKKELEQTIFNEIEKMYTLPNNKKSSKKEFAHFKTKGAYYDLQELFNDVNAEYFNNSISAKIKWSGRIGGTSFHSKRIAKSGTLFNLISISAGYDHKNCPIWAIKGVIYHEMLHIAIPPKISKGRRIVHSSEFRRAEKKYRYYDEWISWHANTLRKNIASLKRKKTLKKAKDAILKIF